MIKRVALGIAAIVFVLVAVVAVRTLSVPGPAAQSLAVETPAAPVDANLVAQRLSRAITFQTVSYGGGVKEAERTTALRAMQEWMDQTYPYFHDQAGPEVFGESLLFTWHGTNPNLPPVLLMAHMDVAPVTPGSEKEWTHAPFSGDVADGFVWGRGALDSKGQMIPMLEAAERLASSGFQPERTVMFAFGEDRETGGIKSSAIAKALMARGTHFAWVLDEGSAIVNEPYPGLRQPVAFIGTAEKGFLSLELVAHGKGAAAATRLSEAIRKVRQDSCASDIDSIQRAKFEVLMPMLPLAYRAMLANLWLAKPLAMRRLQASPELASVLHTTMASTAPDGSGKTKAVPDTATGIVNFRLHQRDSTAAVLRRVRAAIADDQVDVSEREDTLAEPSAIVEVTNPAYIHISDMIRVEFGVPTAPELVNEATDSRYYSEIADAVLRFRPIRADLSDLPRIHGTDERVAVEDLGKAAGFYMRLIQDLK